MTKVGKQLSKIKETNITKKALNKTAALVISLEDVTNNQGKRSKFFFSCCLTRSDGRAAKWLSWKI